MKSTKNIKISEKMVDQVIGQDEAVNIIKKAAQQRRHVLLIGEPGTGKSMLGLALAELLPKSNLKDIISIQNPNDENNPTITELPAGTGREEVKKGQLDGKQVLKNNNFLLFIVAIFTLIAPWWVRHYYKSDIMFAAFFLGGMMFLGVFAMMLSMGPKMFKNASSGNSGKVIVDNFGKKEAPFFDATGAHAGALLGDVLHDPFQCFSGNTMLSPKESKKKQINKVVASTISRNKNNVYKKEKNNYEAVFLPKGELTVLGENNNSISTVEVLSCNRHSHNGEMIKLTTSENKELIVTPEHAVAIWKHGKISYVEARDVKKGDEVVSKAGDIIIDEEDIINTFVKEQQHEQAKLYYQYKKIKEENPTWGYKRISKAMRQPEAKTRWWHAGKHIPPAVQTIEWLKEKKLLPLKIDHKNLPLIAKVLGATFGNGGIFQNLNAIFLSSSELEATEEFGKDLIKIFGKEIHENSRTIEGGEYGHSWCYQNTNRGIIRLFKALGAPIGKKTNLKFVIPNWVPLSHQFESEFYGSFLGNELGVPKVHKQKNRLDLFSLGISCKDELLENKKQFLNQLRNYLFSKEIKCTSIGVKEGIIPGTKICRLLISTKLDNVMMFERNIKINYCKYKQEKLSNTIKEFKQLKKERYHSLIKEGYGAESVMKLLQLNPHSLYTVLNEVTS